jgi:hypothetical protein
MTAFAVVADVKVVSFTDADWDEIAGRAPQMAATLRRFLIEVERGAAPTVVDVTQRALRQLAGGIVRRDRRCRSVAAIERRREDDAAATTSRAL